MKDEIAAIRKLLTALETCHVCGGAMAMDDVEPTHCENCSGDCDEHWGEACAPLFVMHHDAITAIGRIENFCAAQTDHATELYRLREGMAEMARDLRSVGSAFARAKAVRIEALLRGEI